MLKRNKIKGRTYGLYRSEIGKLRMGPLTEASHKIESDCHHKCQKSCFGRKDEKS